jgi:nucleoside-diphosphate-sugar epimerase
MKILITGSEGYIGSALVDVLQSDPRARFDLKLVDIKNGPREDIVEPVCRHDIGNWCPDVIVNLAGVSGIAAADREGRKRVFEVNSTAAGLLRDTAPCALFIQAGSMSSYDRDCKNSPYAWSKTLAERSLSRALGPLVLFRFGTLFGFSAKGKTRWDLPGHKIILDAVDKGVISVPAQRMNRPWLLLPDLLDSIVRLVTDYSAGYDFRFDTPIPVVTFNESLHNMAKSARELTQAKIVYKEDHKDTRTYSAPALCGGPDFVRYAKVMFQTMVKEAYEHSLKSAGEKGL